MKIADIFKNIIIEDDYSEPILIKEWNELDGEVFGEYVTKIDGVYIVVYNDLYDIEVARFNTYADEYLTSIALMAYDINVMKDGMFL